MKRKALVKAPVAKTNLKYTSQSLALVDSAHVYWTVNNQEVILDDDKDYQEQKCVISYFVKKEVTAGTTPAAPTATENGWVSSIPTQIHAGTYYVWTKMTGNYDYEDVDVCTNPVKVVIAKADATLNASANSSTLTYNGNAQNLLASAATLTIGTNNVTSAKDASNTGCTIQYYVSTSDSTPTGGSWGSSYSATNAGTYYIWIKVTGNGDIKDIAQVRKATKQINKKTQTISLSTSSYTFWPENSTTHPNAYYCDVTVNNSPDDSLISVTVTGSTKYSVSYRGNHVWRIRYTGTGGEYSATVNFRLGNDNYETSNAAFICS